TRPDQTIPITGKDQSKKAQEAMDQLKQRYSITGGDDLQWFLGIEVIRDRSKQLIHLSQVAYYEKINRLVDDQTIRHDTPMATSELMPREGLATP
ncbi:calcium-binding mitochondrial carrier protein Aralar2, partial [Pyrenophora tritici-repentis]